MIRFTVYRNEQGVPERYHVEGHSDFGPTGSNIVCAAVSAITQAAAYGLDFYGVVREVFAADGRLDVKMLDHHTRQNEVEAIVRTMLLGLLEIEKQYPDQIRVKEEHV